MEPLKKWYQKWFQLPLAHRLGSLGIGLFIIGIEGSSFIRAYSFDSVRVVAAKRALSEGTVITIEDLTVARVPTQERDLYFSEQEVQYLIGARVVQACLAREPIAVKQLRLALPKSLSVKVPRGLRAYPLTLTKFVPLEAGDRVDIIGVPENGGPEVAVENREVLVVQKKENSPQVFVAVSLEEARKLDSISTSEDLTIMLRNPNDHSISLKKDKAKKAKQSRIEIIQEE